MSPLREITERYRLEKILKSTRSGSVLRATDSLGGGTVIVKLLALGADSAADGERFLGIAGTLAGLEHPSLPLFRDFGLTTDGSAFLVMEHVEGRSASTLAGTDPKRILGALAPVAEGLALLASRGLSHGNLSPDNLLLAAGRAEVKMLGLGTALFRVPGPAAGGEHARFRAPEELAAQSPPAAAEAWRADVYSFASTACYLLEVPMADPAAGTADGGAEGTEPPELSIPLSLAFQLEDVEPLRRFLAGALSHRPSARPSFAAAREAIQRGLHGAPAAAPTLEETRPAFLSDTFDEESPAPAMPAIPAAPATLPPIAAAPPAAAVVPAVVQQPPEPPSPRIAIPPPPKVSIPAPAKLAIPEPPKPAVPAPASFAEDEGELLTSIDDDVLAAMSAPPPKPPPAAALEPAPASRAAGTGTTAWKARLMKPVPLAAAGGALLLILIAAVLWSRSATPPVTAAKPAAAPSRPAPPPIPPPDERLLAAEEAVAAGNDHEALVALRSITPAEQRTLPPDACRQIQSLEEILALTAPARLAADLQNGWKSGDLELLRRAARAAADQPGAAAVLPAAARETLDRARRAADLYDLVAAAAAKGDRAGALARFGELAHAIPSFHDDSGLRDQIAGGFEAEAGKLVKDARYEEALARLDPLRQSWPERPGLKAEVEAIRDQEKNEQILANLLAAADNAEKRRRPDEGIDLLSKVKPTPHLEAEYNAQMGRLQALLGRVDGQPPTIDLRDGYVLDYDRGTVANLSFRIRDDYKVTGVKVFARPGGGGRMVELPYKKDGFVYDVAVQPSFHQNGTVDFYVVASDYSGHETSLGTKDKPLQLKRRKGFRET